MLFWNDLNNIKFKKKIQLGFYYHCWREHVLLKSLSSLSTSKKLLLLPFTRDSRTPSPRSIFSLIAWKFGMVWVARESLAESLFVSIDLFEIFELLCRINDPVDLPFIVVKVDPDLALVFLKITITSDDLFEFLISQWPKIFTMIMNKMILRKKWYVRPKWTISYHIVVKNSCYPYKRLFILTFSRFIT